MTFEDYWSAVDSQPTHIPGTVPPPGVTPTRTDLLSSYSSQIKGFPTNKNQRTDLLKSYSDNINSGPSLRERMRDLLLGRGPIPPVGAYEIPPRPSATPGPSSTPSARRAYPGAGSLVGVPFMSMASTLPPEAYAQASPAATPIQEDLNPGINADLARFGRGVANFAGPRSTTNPSFQPMRGEQLALQMPGLTDWWNRGAYQEPPNFRSMPTMNYGPEATPYPAPPWLNLRNWMDTGERGPLPLQWYSPGGYPSPANTPMPEAYDALTSGGALG